MACKIGSYKKRKESVSKSTQPPSYFQKSKGEVWFDFHTPILLQNIKVKSGIIGNTSRRHFTNRRHFVFPEKEKMKFGLAASSVAGQTMQLVGAEDAFTVSTTVSILSTSVSTHIFFRFRNCYALILNINCHHFCSSSYSPNISVFCTLQLFGT